MQEKEYVSSVKEAAENRTATNLPGHTYRMHRSALRGPSIEATIHGVTGDRVQKSQEPRA